MNRKTLSLAIAAMLLPLASHAAVSAIATTGWNQDLVINNPSPYDASITSTMDGGIGSKEGYTWVEAGNYIPSGGGSAVAFKGFTAGTNTSLTGNGTFAFQNFTGNNAFLLTQGVSGTLSLTTPAAYTTLALYGSTANGGITASIVLTFSDNSTSTYNTTAGTGIGADWFNTRSDRAVIVGGRASNKKEEGYTRLFQDSNDAIAINETYLTLTAGDQAKTLTSVTITNTSPLGSNSEMAVFALSGQAVPEASSALLGLVGAAALLRRRRA